MKIKYIRKSSSGNRRGKFYGDSKLIIGDRIRLLEDYSDNYLIDECSQCKDIRIQKDDIFIVVNNYNPLKGNIYLEIHREDDFEKRTAKISNTYPDRWEIL